MLTNFRRVIKWGFLGFMRNSVVSFSSILVLVIALLMIGSTIILSAFLNTTLLDLESKIDVNVYLIPTASEENISKLVKSLELLPEVASVEYVSREQAIEEFELKHQNDQLILQALDELDENPLRPRLNIQAVSPDMYSSIQKYLSNEEFFLNEYGAGFIEKDTYKDHQVVIERMTNLIRGVEKGGVMLAVVLVLISILITFNTIRLAIYISKDQISVMRLVGASKAYVRGPFIVEGIVYGIFAAIIAMASFYPITLSLKRGTESFYGGIDLFEYYITNFEQIFVVIMTSGILLGAISSYLAVRRYLRD